jgi:hypothetical protein
MKNHKNTDLPKFLESMPLGIFPAKLKPYARQLVIAVPKRYLALYELTKGDIVNLAILGVEKKESWER